MTSFEQVPLSDGAIAQTIFFTLTDQLRFKEYLVNEIQEAYRLQGVKINESTSR